MAIIHCYFNYNTNCYFYSADSRADNSYTPVAWQVGIIHNGIIAEHVVSKLKAELETTEK